jgi:DNA polymerase III delta prime subunit
MWINKYKPVKISEIIGNKSAINKFTEWINNWNNEIKHCALIYGINGIGKSLFIELYCKENKWNSIIIRDVQDEIFQDIDIIIKKPTNIFAKKNILIIDNFDNSYDTKFITKIIDCAKTTKIPIILICNEKYCQKIKSVINYCTDINFKSPIFDELYAFMTKIYILEKLPIHRQQVLSLYEISNGDIRFIINNLELQLPANIANKDIHNENLFYTTEKLLSISLTEEEKYKYYKMNTDMHLLMIQENYPNCIIGSTFTNYAEKSADYLSIAEIFDSFNIFDEYTETFVIGATENCNKSKQLNLTKLLGSSSSKQNKIDVELNCLKACANNTAISAKSKTRAKAEPKAKKETKPRVKKEAKPKKEKKEKK